MLYKGQCHCGCIRVEYQTEKPVILRRDGCSFCASRGVKSASDPAGQVLLAAQVPMTRYRFGHKTADYLICSICGTYVASIMPGPNGLVGVINVVGLNILELRELSADVVSLDGETVEGRLARRLTRWTPFNVAPTT